MSIERKRTLNGYVAYEVWAGDNCIATFPSYCDAVDFLRFMEEI